MKTEEKRCWNCKYEHEDDSFNCNKCDDSFCMWEPKDFPHPTITEDKLIGYVDYMNKLIEYIALLDEELNETAIIAYNHGWRTTRKEEGEDARSELDKIAKSLLLPSFTAALQLIKDRT